MIPTSAQKRAAEPKVAVLLNGNAHQVSEKVVRSLLHVVPEEDLFFSRRHEDVAGIVSTLLDRRYDTVFCGGGDGTFTALINELSLQLEARARTNPVPAPRLGMLKLGTGNALAAYVKASPLRGDRILDDVLRARAGEVPGYRRIDLLTVNGKRAVFAGMGLDGRVLNDYASLKRTFKGGPLASLMSGPSGYFASVTLRTIPAVLTQPAFTRARVVNGTSTAYRLGHDGEPVEEFHAGQVLFEGDLNFVAAATAPFYGYELKMFPFAGRRRGMMQLRFAKATAPQVVANLPKIWKGRWFPEYIYDFHTASATIELDRPMPLQVGGDAEGYHRTLELGIAPEPVELVDFSGSVQ